MHRVIRHIKLISQTFDNLIKRMIFFLHFLMVTTALFSLTRAYEICHCLEYLVHPPQMTVNKMVAMYLEKPVITFILFLMPVTCIFI